MVDEGGGTVEGTGGLPYANPRGKLLGHLHKLTDNDALEVRLSFGFVSAGRRERTKRRREEENSAASRIDLARDAIRRSSSPSSLWPTDALDRARSPRDFVPENHDPSTFAEVGENRN